jgi:hypothetical protein
MRYMFPAMLNMHEMIRLLTILFSAYIQKGIFVEESQLFVT